MQVLPFVLQGALAYGIFRELGEAPGSVVLSLRRGFRRLPTVLGTTLLVVLLGFMVAAVPFLLGLALGDLYLGLFGLLVGFAAMVFLQSVFLVAVPAAVTEEPGGPARAMARSAFLTEGSRPVLVLIAFAFLAQGWLLEWTALEDLATVGSTHRAILLHGLGAALFGLLQAVVLCVIYVDLGRVRGGGSSRQIVDVFD